MVEENGWSARLVEPIVFIEINVFGDPNRILGRHSLTVAQARALHAELGACLGALDAETHPSNPATTRYEAK